MNKNPPTLADACIATALDKRMGSNRKGSQEVKPLLLQIANARKFVLDQSMSAYLSDLSQNFWRGGLRNRLRQLENARHMARLPHRQTWIEFSYPSYLERFKAKGGNIVRPGSTMPGEPFPTRVGWLLQQHDKIETAFIATEVSMSTLVPGRALMHPVSIVWRSDEAPLPWRTIKLYKEEPDGELLVMITGYRSTQVAWTFTYSEKLSNSMMRSIEDVGGLIKPTLLVRDLWALLATLNDLPVVVEHVRPSKGYIHRGSYHRFLEHKVIHLTVPETRWFKVIVKSTAALRRRAHQVRGHLRDDWRQRPSKDCNHCWNDKMICRYCGGHQIWINEHQRGDASLGFVTHDYEVNRHQPTPRRP